MKGLTQQDRVLIAEAIAAGKLRKIAQGVSGLPLPVWDGKQLVNPDPVEAKRVMRNRLFALHRREPGADVRARREAVAQLYAEGLCVAAIADRLDRPIWQVRSDHAALSLPANRAPALPPPPPAPHIVARRARIAELAAAGATLDEIAADIGFSPRVTRQIAALQGLTLHRPRGPKPLPAAVMQRRAAIRACLEEGLTQVAICERLGLKRGALLENLRSMGVRPGTVPTGHVLARSAALRARQARVAELMGQGATLQQLLDETGAVKSVIYADLRDLGLSFQRSVGEHGPARSELARETIAARRERVRALVAAGQTRQQMMQVLGISLQSVNRDIEALGLAGVVRKGVPGPVVESDPAAREARLAEVARLLGAGTNHRAILRAVGGTIGRLRSDLKALAMAGVIVLKPRDPDRKAKIAARRAEVAQLLAAGVRPAEIQRRVGGSNGRIDRDIDVARRMLEAAKPEMQVAA